MKQQILFADDEIAFLRSMSELLRRDGYDCDSAPDGREAVNSLRQKRYDLLIADIRMPGNANLQLIKEAEQIAAGLPVILVTGYPSLDSAIQSIQLPVVAYLKKPFPYAELHAHVQSALAGSAQSRLLSDVQERLRRAADDLELVQQGRWARERGAARGTVAVPEAVLQAVASCVGQLLSLETARADQEGVHLCTLMSCPQGQVYSKTLAHAINVLRETRQRFKSNELGELRESLERILGKMGGLSGKS